MMRTYNLPVGYRFCPTEEELLTLFLRPKLLGLQPPQHGVIEKSLYSNEATPWMILNETTTDRWQPIVDCLGKVNPAKKVIYVITKLSKVAENGTRRARTAGCGTWHGTTASKNVRNSRGQLIGKKRSLTFESASETVGQWNMDEFELAGISLEGIVNNDHVICRIKRDDSRSSKEGRLVAPKENLVPLRTSNDNIDDGGLVQVQDDDDQNVVFSAPTLSHGNDNYDSLAERKSQFEEEEISHQPGKRMCRSKNEEQVSNIGMASEVAATATSSEMQNEFDGAVVEGNNEANNQVGYGALLFDDSEVTAEGELTHDNFLEWLNDVVNFNH